MQVTLENGKLCLRLDDGRLYASDISAELIYTGPYRSTLRSSAEGQWKLSNGVAQCGNVTITFTQKGNGMLIHSTFTNNGDGISVADSFNALTFRTEEMPVKALVNRPHRCNGVSFCDMQSQTELVSLFWGSHIISSDFAAIQYENSNGIFGFVTNNQSFTTVEISGDGIFKATQQLEKHSVRKGETLQSDIIYICPCGEIYEALPQFGDIIAQVNNITEQRFPTPSGHCSWYYCKNDVTEDYVRENADWFYVNKSRFPVEYIQIDDGWYDNRGDWNPNSKFSNIEKLSLDIRSKNFVPGIWFCPVGADEKSVVFAEHPDWFVKGSDGNPQRAENGRFCFDFSQDDVCIYIRNIIKRFTEQWHFGYIKMDIVSPTLCGGVYSDSSFNSLKNLRKCLSVIRQAAGRDVFLLGCTMPFLAAVGTVDGMRTSGDVFDNWESLPWIFGRVIKRYWMNGRLFHNDADCLIVRTAGEEDELCRRPCSRNKTELETFVTAMIASGGALMLSDRMSLLKDWQLDLLSQCFPLNTRAAVPLDIMVNQSPSVLDFGECDGVRKIAVINWENREKKFELPCGSGIQVTAEPHSSKIIKI